MPRWLPWAITAVVCIAFVALKPWERPPPIPVAPSATAPTAPSPSPPRATTSEDTDDDDGQLRLLGRCRERLERTKRRCTARIAEARATTAPRSGKNEPSACLEQPEVLAALDEARLEGRRGWLQSAEDDRAFAKRFATNIVGLPDTETAWLENYMCEVHDVRQAMIDELRDPKLDPLEAEALIAAAREDRQAMLADVADRLGKERYDKLRAVGGLGLMASALRCGDNP